MDQQIFKDALKYAFAECLVFQTTKFLNPQWDFQRLVQYTPLYTDSIQRFVRASLRLHLYYDYLPSTGKVLHKYKKVLQPIVRYQMTIGYDALELLVFGTFLGYYCARLHYAGIDDAPDYAVIAIANALKFFDDTDQFEDDGWTRLDACARELMSTPVELVNEMVSTSKMGERIEQFLSEYVNLPPPAHAASISQVKVVSYADTGSKNPNQTPKTTELQKNNPTPYTNWLQKHRSPHTTAISKGCEPTTVGYVASTLGCEPLLPLGITQMNSYQNIRTLPVYYYLPQK